MSGSTISNSLVSKRQAVCRCFFPANRRIDGKMKKTMTTSANNEATGVACSLTVATKRALLLPAALVAALALSACSEDIIFDDPDFFGKQVKALVTKGPISGSSCRLYRQDDSQLAGPKTTDSDGRADFGYFASIDDTDIIYVQCTGGQYTDEATGSTKTAPSGGMRSGARARASTITLVVTPITEVAFRDASTDGKLDDLETYNQNVAKALGLGSGFHPAATEPTDLNNASAGIDSSGQYAGLLATLSQLHIGGGLGNELDKILDNLERCIDGAKGTIDKTCAQVLIDSVTELEDNEKVKDKVSDTASTKVKTNLDSVDVTSDDTFVITDASPDALNVPAAITTSITLTGEGLDNVTTVNLTNGATTNGSCSITSKSDTLLVLNCSSFTTDGSADAVTLELVNAAGNKVYNSITLSTLPINQPTFAGGAIAHPGYLVGCAGNKG